MYSVTESYITAVRSRKRTDRITGKIVLAGGAEIAINDTVLVKDTLKITKELCSGRYRIGTFCLSKLKFSFFLADALGLDLAGAYADLTYGIKTAEDTYEDVPLGRFYIDPVLSTRRKDIVSIVGFDAGIKFDRDPSASVREMKVTPPELIAAVCAECGVPTDITAGSLPDMPNSTLAVNVAEKQIQSCRDILMWCAALMCGYAVIARNGKLCIIPAKYDVEPEDPTVIVVDRNIREDERESISVTDTRAYIRYLTAYVGSDIVNYTSTQEPADEQASPASYTMEKNPLMAGLTEAECDRANRDWLTYIQLFQQRGVEARIFGDPALDTGDTIMFRGGDVDQRGGIAGVITGIDWCYRGYTVIKCLAAQCCGSLENGGGAQSAGLPQVRTQTHKRIDSAIAGGSGTGKFLDSGKTSVSHNDNEHNKSTQKYDNISGYKNSSTGSPTTIVNDVVWNGADTIFGEHNTLVNGTCVVMFGNGNSLTNGGHCMVGGDGNEIPSSMFDALLIGSDNTVQSFGWGICIGQDITVDNFVHGAIFGKNHNIHTNGRIAPLVSGDGATITTYSNLMFVIGNSGNIFTVDTSGNVASVGSILPGGADYAEFFEWEDGNPCNEDRRGMLVALDGDKIIPAHENDFIGVISATPSVVGNNAEMHWHGKYKTDVFGQVLYDEAGDPCISDEYRKQKYIPRSERPEWGLVGLVGRLVVTDDGSCKPGGYVSSRSGIGTSCSCRTNACVLRRIDDTHVEVLIK